ncbi:MAG: inorganic pyrophosphatase [Anaerolineales bacterium]|nr:inorganic pyrophosphatase [Chloroflexota bacterium]MBL7161120.1 inorganic pyrophosphatase [Anaerolineales bacterium]
MSGAIWSAADKLVESSELIIDRPKGSAHPRYPEVIYPLDYGYLAGTSSGDGGGIDVWVGSLSRNGVTGLVCTIDLTKKDAEVKLLIGCTEAEAKQILAFHNSGSQAATLIMRLIENG